MEKVKKNTNNFLNKVFFHPRANGDPGLRTLIFFVLFLILFLSFFLRFYRLRDYITFLGDQGRDVWVVKKMVLDGKFTLLGPVASVGGFYLGPLYYYFITPFLILTNFDPIGPAVFPALLGALTPFVLFLYLKKKSFLLAFISSFLYAISPVLVKYNRFSWNPNVVPFFSLLFFIALEKFLKNKKNTHAVLTGILLGILFQLHYLAFVFVPVTGIMLIIVFGKKIKSMFKSTCFLIMGVIFGWFPFILYEVRHNMQNFSGLLEFISRRDGANVGFDASRYLSTIVTNYTEVISYLFNFPNLISVVVFFALMIYLLKKRSILSNFILISFIILSLYKGKMGEHYFNIVYIFILIAFSDILSILLKSKFLIISGIILPIVMYFSVQAYPFWKEPNRQLDQTIEISKYILNKYAKNADFNFALVTSSNSDNAYRYFFDLWGNPPGEILNDVIDPKRNTVAKKLIILCEPLAPCTDPRGASLWEIAAFGRAEIVSKEKFGVYTIYEMKHYEK